MKRIAILGSSGMIGSGVTAGLAGLGIEVSEFNRSGSPVVSGNDAYEFNLNQENLAEEISKLGKYEFILNFTGVIRHKIDVTSRLSKANAFLMNVVFPSELNELASRTNCKILQVGTDCVFSGRSGEYDELSIHDPIDFYGETKSEGESHLSKTMNIRVSVVGRELDSNVELMNWLLSQPLNAEVEGFTNHLWNGVTPIQLAKLINSIFANNLFVPGTLHLVPSSSISKYELLQLIARLGGRSDLRINPVTARTSVDRTLRTAFPARNKQLWATGGYQEIPNIQDMIVEYMDWSH